ncbi:amino acid/amide ABC transporter membrane protein 1, HAAT family /amino acid/amide ABC transporter membrane protein 2, HAAT family [Tistlia consotensis]|uniref:Amino acid/amide ABC transporter membrane protein 1, HAAT family /amino acid/amide ABC transporter membrane protein 2, HAAT family n=1 Tax=Tistlia consotensis USBA 355 TaxID=560819 RepID=A0A1Y6BSH1_9PROT|nr:ABC transporter permease [Tistlia consotensis]SMF17586.1 amino acid/amide ABC transporter membrane protein 1, HAAT family /amino acid/amide ABC transporter membrane protein 2, HAAT family [Tistlia consotensis USBA 355]SNR40328.1 amino acid/amide ABC transporter membrane protein 1, HAAT family /amino acid/amide ABC transporter membrane protein 2, HAAT family [Tistlia consotensis]
MTDPAFLLIQFLNGLASASNLFLIACGLSIIFGVTRIVNFAHGSFYMLGAYFAFTLADHMMPALGDAVGFWLAIPLAAVGVGLFAVLVELVLLRRIYRSHELFQLLATFGVVLIVQDLVPAVWGPEELFGPRAPGFTSFVTILGFRFPEYQLVLIAAGPLVLGALWLLFNRTRWGTLVRAATQDREMVGALGVNQAILFTGVLFLGGLLAGLAGALQLPVEPANPFMDIHVIAEAFVVTVVGGMGSVLGAFLAALIIAELQAFGILVFPEVTLVLPFLVMALVLVWRPWGLLGRPEAATGHGFAGDRPLRPLGTPGQLAAAALIVVLLLLPLVLGDYAEKLALEVFVFALFAFSLNFIMGAGGMVSFGHAAYFGLGAYGAALAVKQLGLAMLPALVAAPLLAGLGALAFGWFVVRLSGVYLAMLTLAFAQIAWSTAFQWVELTGGDNGMIGIWPSAWASNVTVYYYLTLLLCGAATAFLWRASFAPFGYTLRAGRDSPLRCDAIGIDVKRHQWLGFALAGTCAGIAGGVFVFSKGNVDPGALSIPTSVDGLVMVLLGGIQTLTGPLLGAAAFHLLEAYVLPLTDYWRALVGLVILLLVVAFPQGLAGFLRDLIERRGASA